MGSTDADVMLMRIRKALFEVGDHVAGSLGILVRFLGIGFRIHDVSVLTQW